MLVGPSFTLNELESHMRSKQVSIDKEQAEVSRELNRMQEEFQTLPKYVEDEEGKKVGNEKYEKLITEFNKKQEEIRQMVETYDFITSKLDEISTIEEKSDGKIDKAKYKINLSLSDCILLGITLEEDTNE